jgi:hypothetical protein
MPAKPPLAVFAGSGARRGGRPLHGPFVGVHQANSAAAAQSDEPKIRDFHFMSLLDIEVTDGATPHMTALVQQLGNRRNLHARLGKFAEGELRDYFEARDTEPNKSGWRALHFWGEIRSATSFSSADEEKATVLISDARFNQKVHGGTITPKEGKFLAIPAREEAYGLSPKTFHDLYFVALSGGRGMLVQTLQTALTRFRTGKRKGEIRKTEERGGGVFYWLVKSVTQMKDERALPPEESFRGALLQQVSAYLDKGGN